MRNDTPGTSNQEYWRTRQDNVGWQMQISMLLWQPSLKIANIYFISRVAHGTRIVFMVVDTYISQAQLLGPGRNVAQMATYLQSVTILTRIL